MGTEAKPLPIGLQYPAGAVFRVIEAGARLSGMEPVHGGHRGWSRDLVLGEEITCLGMTMGWGSDSIPCVHWQVEGKAFVRVRPEVGLWQPWPVPGFLERVS